MIPLQLQLKNFLSYGPTTQTIDFSPYPLICLSGKNGHGKSALLDAITWAVWGHARKTFGVAKADQGLLHIGQRQILVIFDFSFNGEQYRIRREFSKIYGKAITSLDFGIINKETGELLPLTDKTIKKTQEKIEAMLNLDMESFVNSAFLRQGHANEFCKKSARDRKKVLATILGLNRYEAVKALAQEKIKAHTQERTIRQNVQEKRVQEIQQKETIATRLRENKTELTALEKQKKDSTTQQEDIKKQEIVLAKKKQQHELLCYKYEQLTHKETQLQQELKKERMLWKETQLLIHSSGNTQAIEAHKTKLISIISTEQKKLERSLTLKQEILAGKEQLHKQTTAAEKAINNVHQQFLQKIDRHTNEKKEYDKQITDIKQDIIANTKKSKNYEKAINDLDCILKKQAAIEKNHTQINAQFERRREYYQKFIARGNYTNQQLNELTKKQILVQDDTNPSCPLCEQNLSASRKRFLKKKFFDSHTLLTHRITRLKKIITRLKQVLCEQHQDIAHLQSSHEEYNRSIIQKEELEKQCDELRVVMHKKEQQILTLNEKQKNCEQIINALKKKQTLELENTTKKMLESAEYITLKKKIDTLEKEERSNTYNRTNYEAAHTELQAVEKIIEEQATVTEKIAAQKERKNKIKLLCTELRTLAHDRKNYTTELRAFTSLPDEEKDLARAYKTCADELDTLTQKREALLQTRAQNEHEKKRLEAIEKEYASEKKSLAMLSDTIDDYYAIVTATGKNGIQALLIEQAIPEIEHEANALLSRLTNNQAHIIIESLRDLKKGGTKETLDIKISDAVGIRPYELFSGGEAFRIDFALRIALSKLLARRAGTSLQTLIIDEGFSSQDEEGLSHMMDALYKIQDDFAKVIIVSHLPTIKDNFPVHFLVEKNAQGSKIRIMEQG